MNQKEYENSTKFQKSNLSKNIKYLRISKHISQETLAKKLKISRNTISNYECQKSLPPIDVLTDIANLFHIRIEQLLYSPIKLEREEENENITLQNKTRDNCPKK